MAAPMSRSDIPQLLEQLGYRTGAELGVQYGDYAKAMLTYWPSCTAYYLVDMWMFQENYKDSANVPQEQQEAILAKARANMSPWQAKVHFYRNSTREAVALLPPLLDFVYVDARHDYCGATQDVELYWPLVRRGGMLAGHDYMDAAEARAESAHRDWSLCLNGTVHPGAVKGAVNDFARRLGLQVLVTTHDGPFRSWLIMKP